MAGIAALSIGGAGTYWTLGITSAPAEAGSLSGDTRVNFASDSVSSGTGGGAGSGVALRHVGDDTTGHTGGTIAMDDTTSQARLGRDDTDAQRSETVWDDSVVAARTDTVATDDSIGSGATTDDTSTVLAATDDTPTVLAATDDTPTVLAATDDTPTVLAATDDSVLAAPTAASTAVGSQRIACQIKTIPARDLPDPSDVVTNVYNSTLRYKLARNTSWSLYNRGFTVNYVANDPQGSNFSGTALIRYGDAGKKAAKLMRLYIPGAVLVNDRRDSSVIDTVLGWNYNSLADTDTVKAGRAAYKRAKQFTCVQITVSNVPDGIAKPMAP